MLAALYIMAPLCILSFGAIHRGHHFFLMIASLAIAGYLVRERCVRLFIWYVAGSCAVVQVGVMSGALTEIRGAMAMDTAFFFLVGSTIYLAVVHSGIKKDTLYDAICIAAVIQGLLALCQIAGYDPFRWMMSHFVEMRRLLGDTTMTGTLGNPQHLAGFLGISLPFFFRSRLFSYHWLYLSLIPAWVILLSGSLTGLITAIVAVLVYHGRWKYAIFGICGVVIYLNLVKTYPILTNPRFDYWSTVLSAVFSDIRILALGAGPGAPTGYPFPVHSEWVEALFYFGLPGLYLSAVLVMTAPRDDRILYAGFMAAAVNCFGNQALHLAPTVFLIVIILGLQEREKYGERTYFCDHMRRSRTGG